MENQDQNKIDKEQQKQMKLEQKYKEAKISRRIVFITTVVITLLTAGIITGGYLYIQSALEPVDSKDESPVNVEIPLGSGVGLISSILEKNNIIKDATVFEYYVKFKSESGFQAGVYQLNKTMTFDEIIASLKTGRVYQEAKLTVTIPEGLQLSEIAAVIAEKVGYNQEEILSTLNDEEYIRSLMEKYPTLLTEDIFQENVKYPLEGYLFPATYGFVEEKPTIDTIINTMLNKTLEVVTKYNADIQRSEWSVHQFLTMASLIEEEAPEEGDRKDISSVFYNRMEIGMPLQTDPTVLYGFGEHKSRLTFEDYEIDDPYNTYKIQGLPPGPIANAGESSFEAALYPTTTNYFYFLATKEGKVLFSETYEEHNEKYNQYIVN